MLRAHEITQAEKDAFIRLIYEGCLPWVAARMLDSTPTQFRCFRNPKADHYDPEFRKAWDDALASQEHEENFLSWLRDLQVREAEKGNTRMIEKLSYIKDPEWEPLRHANFNVNVNVKMLHEMFPTMSLERLEEMKVAREQALKERKPIRALPEAS